MSACAKEPSRQTGVSGVQASWKIACAKEPSRQTVSPAFKRVGRSLARRSPAAKPKSSTFKLAERHRPETRRLRPSARPLGVQPAGRRGPPREAGRPRQGAEVPGPGADRPRQPLRGGGLLHRLREGGGEADPGLRALRGPGQPLRALEPGRRLRGREPLHGAGAHPRRLRQPHEAGLQGLPRGLLLQAARGSRAAGPARGRAARALGLPQLRGQPAALGRRRGQGAPDRGLVPGGVRQGLLLHGGAVARPRAAGGGDRGHDQDRPRHRRAALRHERLALPRGRALASPTRRCSASRPAPP